MTLANAHALFLGLKNNPSYLANLRITDDEHARLMIARQRVRGVLRDASGSIPMTDSYWQEPYSRRTMQHSRPPVELKFMTQGSFAYGTINSPAHIPQQEIDLDDGMYVPVEFLENGEPALAARGLFAFVETSLKPLCASMGWKLCDKYHENCVRVKLWPGAHIDIPIYSIPRDRFNEIRESLEKALAGRSMTLDAVTAGPKLPPDQIMLAQRSGSWIPSDPQQMHAWVKAKDERYGPVYKRLCKFFKGWRDYTWVKCELSSVCIMTAVDIALREIGELPSEDRDDELIMDVAKHLPDIFQGRVSNPVLQNLCINEWNDGTRREIVNAASLLRDHMVSALEQTGDAEEVVRKLRSRFGTRIPYRPDVVKIGSKIAAIQKAAPAIVAAPRVIPSTSG